MKNKELIKSTEEDGEYIHMVLEQGETRKTIQTHEENRYEAKMKNLETDMKYSHQEDHQEIFYK